MSFFSGFAEGLAEKLSDPDKPVFSNNMDRLKLNPTAFNLDSNGQQQRPSGGGKEEPASGGFLSGFAEGLQGPQRPPTGQAEQGASSASSGLFDGLTSGFAATANMDKPKSAFGQATVSGLETAGQKIKEFFKPSKPDVSKSDYSGLAQNVQTTSPYDLASSYVGKTEKQHAGTLSSFFRKSLGERIDPSQTPWCAAFANSVLKGTGRPGTGSMMAKSFMNYGTPTESPSQGDIAVLTRGNPKSAKGHVGFVDSIVTKGNQKFVKLLGGNQDDSVSYKLYPMSRVLGFRRPPSSAAEAGSMLNNTLNFKGMGN